MLGAHLLDGNDEEGAAARALGDHGDEAGVHGTEVVVVHVAGDGHAVIALVLAGGFAVHVPEFGAAVLWVPRHLQGEKQNMPRHKDRPSWQGLQNPIPLSPSQAHSPHLDCSHQASAQS